MVSVSLLGSVIIEASNNISIDDTLVFVNSSITCLTLTYVLKIRERAKKKYTMHRYSCNLVYSSAIILFKYYILQLISKKVLTSFLSLDGVKLEVSISWYEICTLNELV